MNKARQERLRLPPCTFPEEVLGDYTDHTSDVVVMEG